MATKILTTVTQDLGSAAPPPPPPPLISLNGCQLENQPMPETALTSFVNVDDDCDFSSAALRYIDQLLMEEEEEEETHMLQEPSLDLQAKVRSFYEVLDQKYPPPLQESAPGGQNPKDGEVNLENDEMIIKSMHLESRSKQNAEEFDDVWVYTLGGREKELSAYISDLRISASNNSKPPQCVAKGKKRNRKNEALDLGFLLLDCAKYVAADNRGSADEILRQIRQHSSPFGDGSQRLAHYFANGLEARLAGIGSQVHHALLHERVSNSDDTKAHCTSFISSSFRKVSGFASNKLIMAESEKASKVHIIDFGISYGFQWPTFIQRVAEREGGPPELRITGIDFPQMGSHPAERIEDTGRRLARYAKLFNVPFEYTAIAQRWETIVIEDLKIEEGEFVAVNCLYQSKYLLDETVGVVSSRSMVLDLFQKINPDILIHGIVNGTYNLPLFFYRFREVLFHYSALFDMLETIIPRERPERFLIESVFGKETLNVIACEGRERVERPETYKQWQMRHLRAGFMQLPFERELMKAITYKVRKTYHKDFVVDEENNWMLMSWKGRIISAMSCWKPLVEKSKRVMF